MAYKVFKYLNHEITHGFFNAKLFVFWYNIFRGIKTWLLKVVNML